MRNFEYSKNKKGAEKGATYNKLQDKTKRIKETTTAREKQTVCSSSLSEEFSTREPQISHEDFLLYAKVMGISPHKSEAYIATCKKNLNVKAIQDTLRNYWEKERIISNSDNSWNEYLKSQNSTESSSTKQKNKFKDKSEIISIFSKYRSFSSTQKQKAAFK